MRSYIQGYLDVLPSWDRKQIEDVLNENKDLFEMEDASTEEFQHVLNRLLEAEDQATRFIPQLNKLDDRVYNDFFSRLRVDLDFLFVKNRLVESVLANYHHIFESIISDLEREVQFLKERQETLRLTVEEGPGTIVRSYDFHDASEMETDTESHSHLFKDRDGTQLELAEIIRHHDRQHLSLGRNLTIDNLRNRQGDTAGDIRLMEQRGRPIEKRWDEAQLYGIHQAIDGSNETYWGQVILSDHPIHVSMKK